MRTIMQIAEDAAADWFTRAPKARTKQALALEIHLAILAAIDEGIKHKQLKIVPRKVSKPQ